MDKVLHLQIINNNSLNLEDQYFVLLIVLLVGLKIQDALLISVDLSAPVQLSLPPKISKVK